MRLFNMQKFLSDNNKMRLILTLYSCLSWSVHLRFAPTSEFAAMGNPRYLDYYGKDSARKSYVD